MISLRKRKKLTVNQINFDVEFCPPVLPYNQILCLHHFNLRSLYLQSLQSLLNWIQLHTSKLNPCALNFTEQITRAHFFLLQTSIRPILAQVIYCGKGRQNLASNVTLYPVSVPAEITWKIDKIASPRMKICTETPTLASSVFFS